MTPRPTARGPRHWARALLVVCAAAVGAAPACRRGGAAHVEEVVRVPYTDLVLPKLEGWVQADDVKPKDDAGGLLLRLVQPGGVLGSPRIEIILEPKQAAPSTLEAFTDRNLREMAELEQAGKIRILHVAQQPTQVGVVPAWRVQHEFTLGQGRSQVSLYQVSTFCVFDGRGLTITASGRTELFHPQAAAIHRLLGGMSFGHERKSVAPAGDAHAIDLGRVGGGG